MMSELAEAWLIAGLDDWVPLRAIDGMARRCYASLDAEARRRQVIEVLGALLGGGLVEVGEVADGGFFALGVEPAVSLARVELVYGSGDEDQWGFLLWTNNTPLGGEVARGCARSRQ